MRYWFRTMRKNKGISQRQLALKLSVTPQSINMIELGIRQRDMSYSMMEKLAQAFDVPLQTIIDAERRYTSQIGEEAHSPSGKPVEWRKKND